MLRRVRTIGTSETNKAIVKDKTKMLKALGVKLEGWQISHKLIGLLLISRLRLDRPKIKTRTERPKSKNPVKKLFFIIFFIKTLPVHAFLF